MRLSIRLLAFVGACVSGGLLGYSVADRPPAPILLTDAAQVTNARSDIAPVPVHTSPPSPPVPDPLTVPQTISAWTLQREEAIFDDLTNVYLSVPSDAPLACGPRRRASLMLRCLEDRTAAYVAHDCATPPGDPDGWEVELRLDDAPASTVALQVDSHGEAFGHWTYREARTLIERLTEAQTLHLRFADHSGMTSEMSFPVARLSDDLDVLRAACHWSDVPPWQMGPHPASAGEAISVNASGPGMTGPTPITRAATDAPEGYRLLGERILGETARGNPPID